MKTIESVFKNGLCTGCGTCQAMCMANAIKMKKDERSGSYLPQINILLCNQCGVCYAICPGHRVDFRQLNSEIFIHQQHDDELLGNHLNCFSGYANNINIRFNSASGGIVTALLVFALEQKLIDGALVTRMRKDKPLEPEPFVARTEEEILSASKSKYCPVPANIALREILKHDGKFAVVGLPCHIQGIRKAEQVDKRLKNNIVLHLGIFCAHTDSFKGTEYLLNKYRINKENIVNLDYRGTGWPGNMNITFKNNDSKSIPFDDYMPFLHGGFFTIPRCLLCCDQSAELADISCGDAWLTEIMSNDRIGTSIIISRTDIGQNLLEKARLYNIISMLEIEVARIRGSVTKKIHYKTRSRVARLIGRKIPLYDIKIPLVTSPTYYSAASFFFRMSLSRRYLWWSIAPYVKLQKLVDSIGKLVSRSTR